MYASIFHNVKGRHLSSREIITNNIGQELTLIPAGTFKREFIETWWDPALVVHDDSELSAVITISQPYYMSRTVVTQGQWKRVMNTSPWQGQDFVKDGDDYPAVYVSWDDAMQFCEKLTELEKEKYRLPTEGEWENACRGGTTTRFSFGDDDQNLGSYAWFKGNSWDVGQRFAHLVGQKRPNAFGLFDMHGNVWEWCTDWYDYLHAGPQTDPCELNDGGFGRVLRGGSFIEGGITACRKYQSAGCSSVGFRVVKLCTKKQSVF
jgi:formylglycine-generating enzyme required for sulfatase activity